MNTTEIELRSEDGKSFLETNKFILEQYAAQTLMELMNSPDSPEIRLSASTVILKALGKAEPKPAAPQTTNNIQINTAIAGEAGKALAGLAGALRLMAGDQAGDNAPQTPALVDDEGSERG